MVHQNSNISTSCALNAILKEFDKSLVHKTAEIENDSTQQRQKLLTQYKIIIDRLSRHYPIAETGYNPNIVLSTNQKLMKQ